jgi:hypothetical protein
MYVRTLIYETVFLPFTVVTGLGPKKYRNFGNFVRNKHSVGFIVGINSKFTLKTCYNVELFEKI